MKTYFSILRGINVSGHKLIKMDELKKTAGEIGFERRCDVWYELVSVLQT